MPQPARTNPADRPRSARDRPAPPPVAERRGARPFAVVVVVTMVLLLLHLTTHTVSTYWPIGLVLALIAVVGVRMSRRITSGRGAADAERVRLDAAAEALRHRGLSSLDTMTGSAFEHHIANLCRRDGLIVQRDGGGAGDLGADVIATTPDGRRVVIQCKRYQPQSSVTSPDMQRFLGTVHTVHHADVAMLVTTARRFTKQAHALGVGHRVILINRDRLGLWNSDTTRSVIFSFLVFDPGARAW